MLLRRASNTCRGRTTGSPAAEGLQRHRVERCQQPSKVAANTYATERTPTAIGGQRDTGANGLMIEKIVGD